MKKITLFVALLATSLVFAQETVLSHSTDQTVINGGVACANTETGVATENSFWRSYTPEDFSISDPVAVTGVEMGVGSADFATAGYTVMVRVYTVEGGAFPAGTFNLQAEQAVEVLETDAGTILDIDLDEPFNIDPDMEVAIEVFDDNADVNFRIGQNTLGEDAPSYLSSGSCNISIPTATEDIGGGFPDDFILNLVVDSTLGLNNEALSQVSIYPNPATFTVNVDTPPSVEVTNAVLTDVLGRNAGVSIVNGQIDISNLAKGVYVLSLETTAGTLTDKIVKE